MLEWGTPLDKIAYFAFTKKAAEEARERMPVDNENYIILEQFIHLLLIN
jgi:hypothetical protein